MFVSGAFYRQACAKCSHAGIIFLSGPKMVFSPVGATRGPSKCEIWQSLPNFTFIRAEMWEYSP